MSKPLDPATPARIFAALGDPTRLELVRSLADGPPQSLSELERAHPISRQAVTKHLTRLGEAGLVESEMTGRERLYWLRPEGMAIASDWLDEIGRSWDDMLGRLKDFAEAQKDD